MSESIDTNLERIIALTEDLKRMAFLIPAPNVFTSALVSLSIHIRNAAEAVQAENFAGGTQWTDEQKLALSAPKTAETQA